MAQISFNDDAQKLRRHLLAPSSVEPYSVLMNANATWFDLVDNGAGAAITGEGDLLAIGQRIKSSTDPIFIDRVEVTVDGGSAVTYSNLASTDAIFDTNDGSNAYFGLEWINWNIPFRTSLLVRVRSSTATNFTQAHATVRILD